jgi:predicted adenine nucleotide alpha hydrolase (AANH) superfamily ATPase
MVNHECCVACEIHVLDNVLTVNEREADIRIYFVSDL